MSDRRIDLRSDTITRPTPGMREAMAEAEVGDDVLGDDPTVLALEERVADMLGKEAAAFTPSGTMANQIAIRAHTRPGDAMLIEQGAHVYRYEAGAPAALSGVTCRLIPGDRGVFAADQLNDELYATNEHFPRLRLVALENTHNRGGGRVWPFETLQSVTDAAKAAGLIRHLDGARLWNAIAATGIDAKQWASCFDSVAVCFSKGLGAPVGSAIVGEKAFITEARRARKQFGGAMRQVGIIAAGAMYALDHHRDRLAEDHANAKRLAAGLAQLDGVTADASQVDTNIVNFDTQRPAADVAAALRQADVHVFDIGPRRIRAVTSMEVTEADMDDVVRRLQAILER